MRRLSPPSDSPSPAGHRVPAARWRVLVAAVAGGLVLLFAAPAAAQLQHGVAWTATVNGTSVDPPGASRVDLVPGQPARVTVSIQNNSDTPVRARYVRLSGEFLGLTFYAYTTRVDLDVPPHTPDGREFEVDLLDLGTQASGLLPSQIALLDDKGVELAAKDLQVDVRGKVNSVSAVFGMAIGALTLVLLAGVLWRLATGRLSPNRWRRALAFAAPGLGLGFLVTFTLSALRIALPEAGLWAPLVLGGGIIGFIAGYLSPTPGDEDEVAEEPAAEAGADDAGEPEHAAEGRTYDDDRADDDPTLVIALSSDEEPGLGRGAR